MFRKAKTKSKLVAPKLADMLKNGQIKEAFSLASKKENKGSHLARVTAAGIQEFLEGTIRLSAPGTRFVALAKESTARLVPFLYNVDQTYVIELGARYGRLHKDRRPVYVGDVTVTTWAASTPYSRGDFVHSSVAAEAPYLCMKDHGSGAVEILVFLECAFAYIH